MRVLVLHSDVPEDAPPDELDTLEQSECVAEALGRLGHDARMAPFTPDPERLKGLLADAKPDAVFNMVESVWGRAIYAPLAAQMLAQSGVKFTGARAPAMALTSDKLLTKRLLAAAKLPTAPWSEAPFQDVPENGPESWIVKAVDEDSSLGLDAGAIVQGRKAVAERAAQSSARHGGRWFAERFIAGREFQVGVIEDEKGVRTLPVVEMAFPKDHTSGIVTYEDKWSEDGLEYMGGMRTFDWQARAGLREELEAHARAVWPLFGLTGYARVDFRVDDRGRPFILEINVNPCLDLQASMIARATRPDTAYDGLIHDVLRAAR